MHDDSRAGRAARAAPRALEVRTEPTDSDVDLSAPAGKPQTAPAPRPAAVLGVISVGGTLGALARYEAGLHWPTTPGHFPWTTLWINVLGCALLGVLMVVVTDVVTGRPLLRPLLGTGVLGGLTTFSTFAVDSQRLIATGHAGLALSDVGVSVAAGLAAVTIATRLARRAVAIVRSTVRS